MLIPTFMDSRIARWVHRQVQILRTRAAATRCNLYGVAVPEPEEMAAASAAHPGGTGLGS